MISKFTFWNKFDTIFLDNFMLNTLVQFFFQLKSFKLAKMSKKMLKNKIKYLENLNLLKKNYTKIFSIKFTTTGNYGEEK
jgi:hypothetical protein